MKNIGHLFMAKEDFFDDAEESVLFKKTAEEIQREEQENLINETNSNSGRVWSILGHQIFGAEMF